MTQTQRCDLSRGGVEWRGPIDGAPEPNDLGDVLPDEEEERPVGNEPLIVTGPVQNDRRGSRGLGAALVHRHLDFVDDVVGVKSGIADARGVAQLVHAESWKLLRVEEVDELLVDRSALAFPPVEFLHVITVIPLFNAVAVALVPVDVVPFAAAATEARWEGEVRGEGLDRLT